MSCHVVQVDDLDDLSVAGLEEVTAFAILLGGLNPAATDAHRGLCTSTVDYCECLFEDLQTVDDMGDRVAAMSAFTLEQLEELLVTSMGLCTRARLDSISGLGPLAACRSYHQAQLKRFRGVVADNDATRAPGEVWMHVPVHALARQAE